MTTMTVAHAKDRVALRSDITSCSTCSTPPFTGPSPNRTLIIVEPMTSPAERIFTAALKEAGFDPASLTYLPTGVCSHHLAETIRLIDPFHVLLVGAVALSPWRPDVKLGQGRGRVWAVGEFGRRNPDRLRTRFVMAVNHPAAVLRDRSMLTGLRGDLGLWKRVVETDFPTGFFSVRCTAASCYRVVDRYDPDGLAWCGDHHKQGMAGWRKAEKARERIGVTGGSGDQTLTLTLLGEE